MTMVIQVERDALCDFYAFISFIFPDITKTAKSLVFIIA